MSAGYSLISWPFLQGRVTNNDLEQIRDGIHQHCEDICAREKIKFMTLHLFCLLPSVGCLGRDTLIVNVTGAESVDKWQNAVNAMQILVDKYIEQHSLDCQLPIEMRYADKMHQYRSDVIRFNSAEHKLFLRMEDKIIKTIEAKCSNWNVISFRMRGQRYEKKDRPTVLVNIKPLAKGKWHDISQSINAELDRLSKDVSINPDQMEVFFEMTSGDVFSSVAKEMKRLQPTDIDVTMTPPPGASIGPRGGDECGTMGPYVNATDKHGNVIPCFLTCYHVIRGGVQDAQAKLNDVFGIGLGPESSQGTIVVDYPAPRDAQETRKKAIADLSKATSHTEIGTKIATKAQETLRILDYFQNGPGLGRVIHASGLYREASHEHRLDWALVQLNDPALIQRNLAVRKDKLTREEQRFLTDDIYETQTEDIIVNKVMKHDQLQEYDCLLKDDSRTSFARFGYVHALHDKVNWEELGNRNTIEDTVLFGGRGSLCFVECGDSGAAVHNVKHEMFGIAVGNSTSVDGSYITPLEFIFEDIKEATGLTITLV